MSSAELAQIITALATLVASIGAVIVGVRNSRKIELVHKTTNSLAMRNEAIAKSLGIAEGKKQERDNPGQ